MPERTVEPSSRTRDSDSTDALLARIEALEARISALESRHGEPI